MNRLQLLFMSLFLLTLLNCNAAHAERRSVPLVTTAAVMHTGWSPKIILFGKDREQIKSMDILHRPNRPLHFYGNTVRWIHYRRFSRP